MGNNVFKHSGDLGDVIYSLPVIKAMGGGHLVLTPARYVRCPFTPESVARCASFFASQPYIKSVQFKTYEPNVSHNLDDFRAVWMKLRRQGTHLQYNLAELFLLTFGLPLNLAQEKWLDVPKRDYAMLQWAVVFNRTQRYLNLKFPWKKVCERYGKKAVFLGEPHEYNWWVPDADFIPEYCLTPTLLDAARVISKAKLFVGNQSCLYAIAEGLKMPRVLEVWRHEPNCCFPGAVLGFDESVKLPDI